VSVVIKLDVRPGYPNTRMADKVRSVEEHLV